MAHYLIYMPGGEKSREHFDSTIPGILHDGESDPMFADIHAGPDGGAGVLVLPYNHAGEGQQERNPALKYDANRQTWHKSPWGWWLGWETERPPTPTDLQRNKLLPGADVQLGDGNFWPVPNFFALEQFVDLDDTGNVVTRGVHKYDAEYKRALPAFEWLERSMRRDAQEELGLPVDPDPDPWNVAAQFEYAVWALARNSRLTSFIAARLNLLRVTDCQNIIVFSTDYEALVTLERELKAKKSAAPT